MPGLFPELPAEGSNGLELQLYERQTQLDYESIEELDGGSTKGLQIEANREPNCPPGRHQVQPHQPPPPLGEPSPPLTPRCQPKQLSAPRCRDQQGTEELDHEAIQNQHHEAAERSHHARETVHEPDGYISPAPISKGGYYVSGGATGFPRPEYNSRGTSVDGLDRGFWEPQQRSQNQVRGGEKEKPGKNCEQGQGATDKKKEGKGKERNKDNSEKEKKEKEVKWKEDKKGNKEEMLKEKERLRKKEEKLRKKEEELKKMKENLKKKEEKLKKQNKEKEEEKRKKEGKERENGKGKKGEKEGRGVNKGPDEKDRKQGKVKKKRAGTGQSGCCCS